MLTLRCDHLMARKSPPQDSNLRVSSYLAAALLTNSNLDVISSGRVFEMVDGAQHIQSHVTDVVRVKGGLVGNTRHHHVGITNRLHLGKKESVLRNYAFRRDLVN